MKKKFIKTPLKGVEVHGAKDVGTRTVNLLMGEHAGEYVRGDIMDANAVVQAFDELKGNVDNNHDSLEEIVDELHNLRDATDQSFEVFQEKAEEETANRIQGDKTLDEKIDQKEKESKERDNTLQQNIDTEKQERINADTQLRNDLTAEVNRAKASENALSENIKAEATKRENDDNTIKDNLNAEVTRATAKENEIKAEVDVINGDSTTEGSFRKAIADVVGAAPEAYDTLKEIADKLNENDDLHAAINDAIATKADKVALNEEITRAKAAEAENKAEIAAEAARAKGVEGDNALAIQNEQSRATLAENTINEALNTEVERAKGQEAYLQNLVNTKADTTALEGAKTELDKKISDETTRATEEEDELRSLITTEQNRATASEKSIADDLNGKLAKKADTTTLNEQVDTLNTAISAKQDAGDYIPCDSVTNPYVYAINRSINLKSDTIDTSYDNGHIGIAKHDGSEHMDIQCDYIYAVKNGQMFKISGGTINTRSGSDNVLIQSDSISSENYNTHKIYYQINGSQILLGKEDDNDKNYNIAITSNGIELRGRNKNEIPTANGGFININDYALKTELPTVPTAVSQLTNDSNFITAADIDFTPYATIEALTAETTARTEALTALETKVTANTSAITNINVSKGIPYDPSVTGSYQTDKPLSVKTGDRIFKADGNIIENSTFYVDQFGLTNNKNDKNTPYTLYVVNPARNGAILVDSAGNLSIGDDADIKTSPCWYSGYDEVYFNGGDNKRRFEIVAATSDPHANIFGIKLTNNVYNSSSFINDPCEIQNNKDYVLFSKKIKVSDIITDATTDSSLNSVLSKKVDTNTLNNFTSYVNGQINGINGALSSIGGAVASKQDKITPTTELDLTSIGTADIESLRSIVKALATELNTLGLIKLKSAE